MTPPLPSFTPTQLERYSRQMLLREVGGEGQARLLASKVLLVGAGTMGRVAALYLAAAGVGRIRLADPTPVTLPPPGEEGPHPRRPAGHSRAAALAAALGELNPEVAVEEVPLPRGDAPDHSGPAEGELVLETSDDPALRRLLNHWCRVGGVTLLSGWITPAGGWLAPSRTGVDPAAPCLACPAEELTGMGEAAGGEGAAVPNPLAPLAAGVVGCLLATEALKILLGMEGVGEWIRFDAARSSFTGHAVTRRALCPECGHG